MAVYKRGPLGLDMPPLDGFLVPFAVLLILAGLFFIIGAGSAQPPLSARMLQNPLFLSTEDSTIMQVRVSNPSPEPVYEIKVSAEAAGSTQLSVYPNAQTISSLGPQENRMLEFLVVPIDEKARPFLPGTYKIDVKTKMANTPYQTSVIVNVEK